MLEVPDQLEGEEEEQEAVDMLALPRTPSTVLARPAWGIEPEAKTSCRFQVGRRHHGGAGMAAWGAKRVEPDPRGARPDLRVQQF